MASVGTMSRPACCSLRILLICLVVLFDVRSCLYLPGSRVYRIMYSIVMYAVSTIRSRFRVRYIVCVHARPVLEGTCTVVQSKYARDSEIGVLEAEHHDRTARAQMVWIHGTVARVG